MCHNCGETLPSRMSVCHSCWFMEVSAVAKLGRMASKVGKHGAREAKPADARSSPRRQGSVETTAQQQQSESGAATQQKTERHQGTVAVGTKRQRPMLSVLAAACSAHGGLVAAATAS